MRTLRQQKKRRGGKSPQSMYDENGDLIEQMTENEFWIALSDYICRHVSNHTRTSINTLIDGVERGQLSLDTHQFIRRLMSIFNDHETFHANPRNIENLLSASPILIHLVVHRLRTLSCLNNTLSTEQTSQLMKRLILVTTSQHRRKLLNLLETDTSETVHELANKIKKYFAHDSLTKILEGDTSQVNVDVIRSRLLWEFDKDRIMRRKRKANNQFESRPAPPLTSPSFPNISRLSTDSLSTHLSRDVLTNRS